MKAEAQTSSKGDRWSKPEASPLVRVAEAEAEAGVRAEAEAELASIEREGVNHPEQSRALKGCWDNTDPSIRLTGPRWPTWPWACVG